MSHGAWRMHVCGSMWALVWAHVHVCAFVCSCVISELNILFRIFTNLVITRTLYTHRFTLICVMWDYFLFFYAQVTWRILERAIPRINHDRRFLLKAGDTWRVTVRQ